MDAAGEGVMRPTERAWRSVQGEVGGEIGQDPAIVAEGVAPAEVRPEQDGVQILRDDASTSADREDGRSAKGTLRLNGREAGAHDVLLPEVTGPLALSGLDGREGAKVSRGVPAGDPEDMFLPL